MVRERIVGFVAFIGLDFIKNQVPWGSFSERQSAHSGQQASEAERPISKLRYIGEKN